MPPRLSIILPTFNRAELLPQALAALQRQTAPASSYEVIVVDNNSTDGTAALLSGIGGNVRSVREERQGLSFARNAGLAAALGEIVAFTDDDVEVAPDWVETVLHALDSDPSIDGAGGRVLPAWRGPQPAWLTRTHWAPLALQDHGDCQRVFDRDAPIGLVGANVAFRREVFDWLGAFSPEVQRVEDGIGSTEDHEFLSRLYDGGGRMLYLPGMLVVATVQPDRCERRYHRRWHEGHGRFHALMRSPEMERAKVRLLGVPGHLLRTAVRDAWLWLRAVATADWNSAFAAELRLRFFRGFVRTRVTH